MKRAFDVVSSAVALAVLWPVMGCVAAVLRVRHGSPVLFTQTRVGLHGEPFELHKFRTMEQRDGLAVTAGSDPRVHAAGRVLRATKMDELPQLWDVLRGKMSVVGPRPEVAEFVSYWPANQREQILSVRPGITDPASIRFRHESEVLAGYQDPYEAYIEVILPQKCELYVDYVQNRSFIRDLKIILGTLRAVFKERDSS